MITGCPEVIFLKRCKSSDKLTNNFPSLAKALFLSMTAIKLIITSLQYHAHLFLQQNDRDLCLNAISNQIVRILFLKSVPFQ